ncbi:hypothetical protein DFH29DRAFT_979401 [Suillus ampliporus]|nr:hypothetical protein DFH29DRAFT_979401 [Suillus ampliporus]
MSKPKAKAAQTHQLGYTSQTRTSPSHWGIANLSETVASSLASRYIDQALRVLNIEPLYGHNPHNPPAFRRALPFPNAANRRKLTLPKRCQLDRSLLAVEGVQPLIPENPPAIPKDVDQEITKKPFYCKKQQQQQQQLVKQVLSRELQLYYTRLTASLLPPTADSAKRTAALASLRNDAGLQALLPYLIRWLERGAQTEADGRSLEVLLDVVSAILENNTLFIEPYLHQLLPAILSTLLHSTLPPSHATHLRTSAAQTLSRLLTQHSTTYPHSRCSHSSDKSQGTREGAIRGLVGIGKEAVRKGLVEGGGVKVVGSECIPGETGPLVDSVMLQEVLGSFFAEKLYGDKGWAMAILGSIKQQS